MSQAAILAAGEGSKPWPFTDTRPPALLPVCNEPMVDRLLAQLRARGVDSIAVAVAPTRLGDQFRSHLADRPGVTVVRTEPRGTAPAFEACLGELDPERPTAVANGDVVTADENLDPCGRRSRTRRARTAPSRSARATRRRRIDRTTRPKRPIGPGTWTNSAATPGATGA